MKVQNLGMHSFLDMVCIKKLEVWTHGWTQNTKTIFEVGGIKTQHMMVLRKPLPYCNLIHVEFAKSQGSFANTPTKDESLFVKINFLKEINIIKASC